MYNSTGVNLYILTGIKAHETWQKTSGKRFMSNDCFPDKGKKKWKAKDRSNASNGDTYKK